MTRMTSGSNRKGMKETKNTFRAESLCTMTRVTTNIPYNKYPYYMLIISLLNAS